MFTNLAPVEVNYVYPRPYSSNVTVESKIFTEVPKYITIWITNIPEGVSPRVKYARIEPEYRLLEPRRLHIYSNESLNEKQIKAIDDAYKIKPLPFVYDLLYSPKITNNISHPSDENFFIFNKLSNSENNLNLTEYRYVHMRRIRSKILYDSDTKKVYNFAPPNKIANKIYIMPENFLKTSTNSGIFKFDNNLIIRIYSKYPISATFNGSDNDITYLDRSIQTLPLRDNIATFFNRLGLTNIKFSEKQIIGYDTTLTAVVGNLNYRYSL